jgi:hypothetical protein
MSSKGAFFYFLGLRTGKGFGKTFFVLKSDKDNRLKIKNYKKLSNKLYDYVAVAIKPYNYNFVFLRIYFLNNKINLIKLDKNKILKPYLRGRT